VTANISRDAADWGGYKNRMAKPSDKATAIWVIRRLRNAGFDALLAGGCVRDMLLNLRCNDYDVATNATPKQVGKLFRRVLMVGAKFGVAMVIERGRTVEVATFRKDVSYSDGRRPDAVRYSSARQDALRRDFTINGMFFDPLAGEKGEVIDYVSGKRDLSRRVIRTIGDPEKRFSEDFLRMIRAVRFAVRLGFKIAPATSKAICRNADKIVVISGERVYEELTKMLSGCDAASAMQKLHTVRLAKGIFPDLCDTPSMWSRSMARLEHLAKRKDVPLSLGAMLCELAPAQIRRIVRNWGGSNELLDKLCFLSVHRQDWPEAENLSLANFKRLMGSRHFVEMLAVWRVEEKLSTGRSVHTARAMRRARGIAKDQVAPQPLITGDKLLAMGLREGPSLGRVLRTIYDAQLNEELTTRREALALARKMIARP